jgi:hypothetical protein
MGAEFVGAKKLGNPDLDLHKQYRPPSGCSYSRHFTLSSRCPTVSYLTFNTASQLTLLSTRQHG